MSFTYRSGQSSQGEILPEGEYPFKVEAAIPKTSSNGNPMIELRLRLPKGGVAFDNLVFSDKSAWHIDQYRTCVGELVLQDEEVTLLPSEQIGKTGVAHIIVETWNGKQKNKVGSYLAPDETDVDSLAGLE